MDVLRLAYLTSHYKKLSSDKLFDEAVLIAGFIREKQDVTLDAFSKNQKIKAEALLKDIFDELHARN